MDLRTYLNSIAVCLYIYSVAVGVSIRSLVICNAVSSNLLVFESMMYRKSVET